MRYFFVVFLFSLNVFGQYSQEQIIKKLLRHYPQIQSIQDNKVYFQDGSFLNFDDKKVKTEKELLENADIEDMFHYQYDAEKAGVNDAGRIRDEAFFKKIYGNSKKAVERKLVNVIWCPKLVGQRIKVSSINSFDKNIQNLSNELDKHPEFKKYLTNIGGVFLWRTIAGTHRLSTHSFGITIDLNTSFSNYWQWDCKCKNEETPLQYKNKIPKKLVAIFEKYGFIWGGNWKHYDTMHFEYRPELLD